MANGQSVDNKDAMTDANAVLSTLDKMPKKEQASLAMALNAYLEGYLAGKENAVQKFNKLAADI